MHVHREKSSDIHPINIKTNIWWLFHKQDLPFDVLFFFFHKNATKQTYHTKYILANQQWETVKKSLLSNFILLIAKSKKNVFYINHWNWVALLSML